MIPAEHVRILFDCTPEGRLIWRTRPGCAVHAGDEAGTFNRKRGFHVVTIEGGKYRRAVLVFAWHFGRWPAGPLLHRDFDKLNDRIDNLTEVAKLPKVRRRAKPHLPGTAPSGRKFKARIIRDSKYIHLGVFATEQEAHAAFAAAHIEIHGIHSPYYKNDESVSTDALRMTNGG